MLKILLNFYLIFQLFQFTFSQICGKRNNAPTKLEDCINSSNAINACCLARVKYMNTTSKTEMNNSSVCLTIPINQTFIVPYLKQMNLGINKNYLDIDIDCGNLNENNNRAFAECGPKNPIDFNSCNIYSTEKSTCCLFSSPDGTSTCLLNPEVKNENKTIFGINVFCEDFKIKINFYFIFSIILIFII